MKICFLNQFKKETNYSKLWPVQKQASNKRMPMVTDIIMIVLSNDELDVIIFVISMIWTKSQKQ